jgi:hypothetical protein
MDNNHIRQLGFSVINKDKWWDMLSRFIDVLRINIFLVDAQGHFILPPDRSRFGGKLLTDKRLGFDLLHQPDFLKQFVSMGNFLENENRYGLRTYAVAVKAHKETIGYLIVGPVVLNKRSDRAAYAQMAKEQAIDADELIGELNELRSVSNMMIKSILELLSEILRDHIEMSIKEQQSSAPKNGSESFTRDLDRVAKEIYASVAIDEILVTLLDVALKMTGAQAGSIMITDKEKGKLSIKASRGLSPQAAESASVKLGEGISGIAAQENRSFVIKGTQGDNRIKHLLKREDIKESLVIPIASKEGVIGVLNLSNSQREVNFDANMENLRYLTTLVSSAI